MKAEKFREIAGRFLLNELGDHHFLFHKFKWHTVEYRQIEHAEKNTSLGTAGYVRTRQIL